jgi:hypothetical protein
LLLSVWVVGIWLLTPLMVVPVKMRCYVVLNKKLMWAVLFLWLASFFWIFSSTEYCTLALLSGFPQTSPKNALAVTDKICF